jgi:hypothetical protein
MTHPCFSEKSRRPFYAEREMAAARSLGDELEKSSCQLSMIVVKWDL